MAEVRDWQTMKDTFTRLLVARTGENLLIWNARVQNEDLKDEPSLRTWLEAQGITGYPQTLLVWERFGYPDWMQASASDLIDAQYAPQPDLRPIFDAIIAAAARLGSMAIQARKTYVSLVSPRRTFARVQPVPKGRVFLGLRLEGVEPGGRLVPSRITDNMTLQINLTSPEEVDDEVIGWLRRAYVENC